MSRHVNSISGRLSLRTPQRKSLEILHRVMEIAPPRKNGDLEAALSVIRSEFATVEDFERSFPSLCFALATGVGKTRLMGAFIAYLHLEHGIRHFFVLAPNLTIYNKLVADFTPNTPKYVFQGIAEFAVKSPALVTGENFEQRPQVLDLFERDDVVVNIFNIAKFNTRAADSRKIRRLSEFLGQSYFDYLAGLDDLVLIMDEAHRYRADSSMKSIEELKPVLGLEVTATPQVEAGNKPIRFSNVIFDYSLALAMRDGYVKEPAVATRANFNPATMTEAALERLKLEDGIRVHESTKVDLDVYAQQNDVRKVKPFMLVIASDTEHANTLVKLIEDAQFFDGRYKGRVIQVHSGLKGAEKDENVERLLSVERADEPTEIVVHVNMLKEGWDVTNLYTIVPLRTADSRTLVEQSIGRGLRLPYGRRTGVPAVDRLTIVAHDRFQDIVDQAKRGGYTFSTVTIGVDVPEVPKQTVMIAPVLEALLGITHEPVVAGRTGESAAAGASPTLIEAAVAPRFTKPEEAAAARLALDAIYNATRDPKTVPGPKALQTEEVQKRLVTEVTEKVNLGQLSMYPALSSNDIVGLVRDATAIYVAYTIAIPRVIVLPKGVVRAGFRDFTLDFSSLRLQPISREILVQHLASETRDVIGALEGGYDEERLEDYVVRGLIDFDDVSYDEQADLLYKLAGQVVAHLRSYLKDDEEVRNVLLFHQKQISTSIHTQMQQHAWEDASAYEAVVCHGFSEVRSQAFAASADELMRDFGMPIDNKSDIRKMLFGGFKKCLYSTQKFDSDPERRFAVVLEKDPAVIKWFKPGKGVFQIRYTPDSDYEPDFVVETATEKLLCEPKRADQTKDPVVLAKAKAAATWCEHATAHENENEGKPWRYVLVPHDAIADNMTVAGLAKHFTVVASRD
ncbi:MAG TPA: DEAD/DEAH box helicase family protein [Candidatus Limnocylindrales bacterium]|nr:DEAD/DEAH box helicase family protein [Candidatus Limnocylindrales bacterium]